MQLSSMSTPLFYHFFGFMQYIYGKIKRPTSNLKLGQEI